MLPPGLGLTHLNLLHPQAGPVGADVSDVLNHLPAVTFITFQLDQGFLEF